MIRTFLVAAAGALLLAAPATAGGWATAGLGPPDDGISAGDTWKAEVMIKQHGITPLVGATPAVIITKGSESHRFPAEPTGKAGVYVANVKFPSGGTWRYQVYDGFTQYGGAQTHSFAEAAARAGSSSRSGRGASCSPRSGLPRSSCSRGAAARRRLLSRSPDLDGRAIAPAR